MASDSDADEQRPAVGVAEVGDDAPELLEEVALLLLDAEQLRYLADDDRQGETDDEALEHRFGDEVGEESEAQQSSSDGEHAGHEGEHAGEGEHLVGSPVVRSATAAADSAAVADIGPTTRWRELPNAA